ncbi:polar amino acid transport system substrate-binding protein [Enhydrobacter aerosaccus]|uniref:Polar amino acid transport system substrate-binding protein n=1 Tax=Enhydrobacter aerosaccus TaxID=225324 RepID=A0A1T4K4R7_9HYPH|nr:transporter substrate-binding domain-containing protein [Enhydrobacter aerosaccus]SJZ37317.1 polar amino acid transport system substrate-binding protein [Enhydrobacter aerosaccus]
MTPGHPSRRWAAKMVGSIALSPLAFLSACASKADRGPTLSPGTLRIGTYFVNPPFEYVSDGQRIGFEVDLMNEIARRLSLSTVFVDTQWETILQEMQAGKYDCIVGGITITPQRRQLLAWSTPYMTTTLSLVVNERRAARLQSLADFKHASVGVQAATTDEDIAKVMLARGEIGSIKVYPFARIADAMVDLAAGRIDAVMKVYPVAAWLARQTPGLHIAAQVPDDPQPLGIGVSRNNPTLLAAIDKALAEMQTDGAYVRLARKWGVP